MWQDILLLKGWIMFYCIPHFLYHLSVRGHLGCFHLFATVKNTAMVCKYPFKILLSILLYIYPEVRLLDHMVILFWIFWETSILFFIGAAPFYILINSTQEFHFLHIFTNTWYFLFFSFFFLTVVNLMGVKKYLIMVLICHILIIKDVEHPFICLLAICISSLEKCLFEFCLFCNWVICFSVVDLQFLIYSWC